MLGNVLPQQSKLGLTGRLRKRLGVFVAVLALVFQTSLQTAGGMMMPSNPVDQQGVDGLPTFAIMCSIHGAMDPRDLGLTPADFGYDDWPVSSNQSQPNAFSCPVCQAHALGQTVLPEPAFTLPQPSGVVRALAFSVGGDPLWALHTVRLTARGPPTAA